MRLIYIANIRLPTEKAHGLQIVQNCEAFADAGADVSLWVARRVNTSALRAVGDIHKHYGVKANFRIRRLPTIDLLPLVAGRLSRLAPIVFALQTLTFLIAAAVGVLLTRADVYYTRDSWTASLLRLLVPHRRIAYEPHMLASGAIGTAFQRLALRGAASIFPITAGLREALIAQGADAERLHVAHDGVRAARFADLPDRAVARSLVGWSGDLWIAGYVGRLQTMAMDKGVGVLLSALVTIDGAALGLVGGPDEGAESLRSAWIAAGGDPARFLYAGQVDPDRVPIYLRAFDAAVMPFPDSAHFAHFASPMKLFEYMASERAIVASDLPSVREVVRDGDSALLVPASDVEALRAALLRLRAEPSLGERLGSRARADVMAHYTWQARATMILGAIRAHG